MRFDTRPKPFKPPRSLSFDWKNFRGGLNTLFREQEIAPNELAQAQNITLVGQGAPTKRPGTGVYFLSGLAGSVRGLKGFYPSGASGSNELLAINDDGLLTKQSNASYSTLTGVSWTSGNNVEMAQVANHMYFVNGVRELARYSSPTLVGFPTIGRPTGFIATQISGISGTNTVGYKLAAVSTVGETAPTTGFQTASQPLSLSLGAVRLTWTNSSVASGIRIATNIYGRTPGDETFLAQVDGEATQFIDDGTSIPRLFAYPPTADSTGGPIAKYIRRFKDRLVFAGFSGDPTLVLISGRTPNHEKFDFGSGGGFVRIEPDSGDDIVAVEIKGDKIIVFKEKSVWQVTLSDIQIGNFFLIEPKYELVTASVGCASQRSVVHVENDIFFLGKGGKGVFILGNEPGIIGDILRTNELSVKIRTYFQNLTAGQEMDACAVYHNSKYMISFPGKNETMVFDRERTAWLGPWTFDTRVFEVYYDSSEQVHLVFGEDDSTNVDELSTGYPGDKGSAMSTILRTRKEDFGDWTKFKTVKNLFSRWRNVLGSVQVDIQLEKRSGTAVTAKSFTLTPGSGNTGWGADVWGVALWGDSEEVGVSQDVSEIVKQAFLQAAARNTQITVKTSNLNDSYELLGIAGEAQEIPSFRPNSWKV